MSVKKNVPPRKETGLPVDPNVSRAARPTTIVDRQLPVTIMVMDVADMGMEAEEEAAKVEVRW